MKKSPRMGHFYVKNWIKLVVHLSTSSWWTPYHRTARNGCWEWSCSNNVLIWNNRISKSHPLHPRHAMGQMESDWYVTVVRYLNNRMWQSIEHWWAMVATSKLFALQNMSSLKFATFSNKQMGIGVATQLSLSIVCNNNSCMKLYL